MLTASTRLSHSLMLDAADLLLTMLYITIAPRGTEQVNGTLSALSVTEVLCASQCNAKSTIIVHFTATLPA